MAYALEIQDIHKVFNRGTINEKVALNGVNLNLNPGDFVTIIGGNGAGKSTTLNAIAGVWPIDSGKIIIDGTDITNLPEHKRAKYLGRVFQDPMTGTAATMDIEENMAIALRRGEKRTLRWGVSREDRELFREKLQTLGLGLEDRMTSKVGLLSGGQRQAMALLMTTMSPIEILILDEHTAALDPKTAEIIMELTNNIVKKKKITTLMVTHNLYFYNNMMEEIRDAIEKGCFKEYEKNYHNTLETGRKIRHTTRNSSRAHKSAAIAANSR